MNKLLLLLLTSVLTGTSSFANATITTGNLLSQDFNNWNGNIPLLNDEIHNDHVLYDFMYYDVLLLF